MARSMLQKQRIRLAVERQYALEAKGVRVCEYFALCTNEAVGVYPHPTIGDVPTCQRCADKMGITLN